MAEYIEREAGCRKCFHYDACFYHITEETKLLTVNECPLFVNKADVAEVRHGEWKFRKSWNFFVCSECSFEHTNYSHYCPNCGADMRGVKNGKE